MTKLHNTLLPILTSHSIEAIEKQILVEFDGSSLGENYTQRECLLRLRRDLINHEILRHQELLLSSIIEFNEALVSALRKTYNESHRMFDLLLSSGYNHESLEVVGTCFLDATYPFEHPLQNDNRQELWEALLDTGWNPLYDDGVTNQLMLPYQLDESFDDYIGMTGNPPNWNEGLNRDLTKDLHLCSAFHNLFDHTEFALTDFIFCNQFKSVVEVKVCSASDS